MTTIRPRPAARALAVLSLVAASGLLLAGCAASAAPTTTATDDSAAAATTTPRMNGVSGEIADVGDALLQVQSSEEQTAVSYSPSTSILATTAATLADVAVGSCVTVIGGQEEAATTVAISAPVDGACSVGGGAGGGTGGLPGAVGGERPEGAPTDVPSDRPDDLPSGAPDGAGGEDGSEGAAAQGGFGGVTSGLVTAVSADSLTVDAVTMSPPGGPGDADAGDADAGTDADEPTTASVTMTVDGATSYTVTAAATTAELVVGACATVAGDTDDSGRVTATSITVSASVDGECAVGPGGRGGPDTARGTESGSGPAGSDDE